jgi:hypothetical protein
MKTPKNEAFEDIERRQGGGFKAKQAMAADKVGPFEKWWYYEGSGPPQKGEDYEEHTKRMCQIAWSNGAYVATQPVQEPVAWLSPTASPPVIFQQYPHALVNLGVKIEPLYTTPPKRTWVGLTPKDTEGFTSQEMTLAKYVSKVLQEKNT